MLFVKTKWIFYLVLQEKLAKAKETAQRLKGDFDELSSDDSEDDDDEGVNVHYKTFMKQKEMPPDFWHVQKLIRYEAIKQHLLNLLAYRRVFVLSFDATCCLIYKL